MSSQSVIHSTFVMERRYAASTDRVFAAFSDPAFKRRWYAEGGNHDVEEFEMEFAIGGREHFQYRFREGTPFPGVAMTSEGRFLDIEPGRLVVSASWMAIGGRRISASLLTVELLPVDGGTDMILTHQGAFYEHSDGPERREGGWRFLLDRLERVLAE